MEFLSNLPCLKLTKPASQDYCDHERIQHSEGSDRAGFALPSRLGLHLRDFWGSLACIRLRVFAVLRPPKLLSPSSAPPPLAHFPAPCGSPVPLERCLYLLLPQTLPFASPHPPPQGLMRPKFREPQSLESALRSCQCSLDKVHLRWAWGGGESGRLPASSAPQHPLLPKNALGSQLEGLRLPRWQFGALKNLWPPSPQGARVWNQFQIIQTP